MTEDSARNQTSDRIVRSDKGVHICMKNGDNVDRVVDSWVEVDDVVVADENNAGKNAERK